MRQAIKLAEQGMREGKGGPFGAVVVKDGVVIGVGCNAVTSSNDPTAHAEMVAIREACQKLDSFELRGCQLYCSCEPCPMCLGAIYWAKPERVYFAATRHDAAAAHFDDSFIYDELLKPLETRTISFEHIGAPEAEKVFEEWLNKEGRIEY